MKQITHLLTIIITILTSITFTNCSQVKLSDQEAQTLIVKTLNLPQRFREDVSGNSIDFLGEGRFYPKLEKAGFITASGNWLYGYKLHVTEKGKPYYMGVGKKDSQGNKTLMFKTFDIDFNGITGIAINKEQETATIRFSLIATNVTPVGRLLGKNIDSPQNGELIFKKFDNGWQLASGQNKTGTDLVKEIFWP